MIFHNGTFCQIQIVDMERVRFFLGLMLVQLEINSFELAERVILRLIPLDEFSSENVAIGKIFAVRSYAQKKLVEAQIHAQIFERVIDSENIHLRVAWVNRHKHRFLAFLLDDSEAFPHLSLDNVDDGRRLAVVVAGQNHNFTHVRGTIQCEVIDKFLGLNTVISRLEAFKSRSDLPNGDRGLLRTIIFSVWLEFSRILLKNLVDDFWRQLECVMNHDNFAVALLIWWTHFQQIFCLVDLSVLWSRRRVSEARAKHFDEELLVVETGDKDAK